MCSPYTFNASVCDVRVYGQSEEETGKRHEGIMRERGGGEREKESGWRGGQRRRWIRFTFHNCVTVIFPSQVVWPHRPVTHVAQHLLSTCESREKWILLLFSLFFSLSLFFECELRPTNLFRDGFYSFIQHLPTPCSFSLLLWFGLIFPHLVIFRSGFISPLISITFSFRHRHSHIYTEWAPNGDGDGLYTAAPTEFYTNFAHVE